MALIDDLKGYVSKFGSPTTDITAKHTVAIVGEIHASAWNNTSLVRATAATRLVLELLQNKRYRYFGNEHFSNAGPVRLGVREYLRSATLPPPVPETVDPTNLNERQILERARSVETQRFKPVLDFLRADPRAVLSIGSSVNTGAGRDRRIAQHFFEELADRKMPPLTPGVILLGFSHASAVSVNDWPNTRMLLEKGGHTCVSILVLTDFGDDDSVTPLTKVPQADAPTPIGSKVPPASSPGPIRLTSLTTAKLSSFPTDQRLDPKRPSPFRSVAFVNLGDGKKSIAEQFEHIVLQKT